MANEDKKDFNAMLHDSKDMPKMKIITDTESIKKYGGSRMYLHRLSTMTRLCAEYPSAR